MNTELKQAIISFMLENEKDYQLVNNTIEEFRQYIYTAKGDYCIGGLKVSQFIQSFYHLINL